MSQNPTSSKSELATPYLPLKPGLLIEFTLFQDVDSASVKLRKGVIVVPVEVQVADLEDGNLSVRTVLGLASLDAYESGKKEVEEYIPLEAIQTMKIDRAYQAISNWQQVVPGIAPSGSKAQMPLSLQRVEEDGQTHPASLKDLFRPTTSRSKRGKKAPADLKDDRPAPYLAPIRR